MRHSINPTLGTCLSLSLSPSLCSRVQPAPGPYDHSVDEREHTVDQWKELIYREVVEYEAHLLNNNNNQDGGSNEGGNTR